MIRNDVGDAFDRLNGQLGKLKQRRPDERQRAAQAQAAGRGAHDASIRAGQGNAAQPSVDPELERRYAALGGSSPAIAGRDFPSAASVEYAAPAANELQETHAALGGESGETTQLSPEDEARFQDWVRKNNIRDVDLPDSHYDYRGFWKQNPDFAHKPGEHFVDTYKQHGHPTFSRESQYSQGPGDGGTWFDNDFVPMPQYATPSYPTPKAPDTAALDRSAGYRPVGTYGYEYKNPNAPGAAPGPQSGPMADELKGLPGVVKPGPDGFDRVDLGRLSLNNASELGQHRRELDDKADRSEVEKLRRQLAALGGATSTGTPDERLGAALGQY